ncbi:hypothetical protein [Sporosarcina psychrophila]|uniref:Uncharacterized protein n=1 Tax=Sporosarcina psychrophila TaxID=1476 RepID=A0ABV2KE34_SPOPS
MVEKFYEEYEDAASRLSAEISPEMYRLVNSFFTLISDYHSYKSKGESDNWFEKDGYSVQAMQIVERHENEYETLSE